MKVRNDIHSEYVRLKLFTPQFLLGERLQFCGIVDPKDSDPTTVQEWCDSGKIALTEAFKMVFGYYAKNPAQLIAFGNVTTIGDGDCPECGYEAIEPYEVLERRPDGNDYVDYKVECRRCKAEFFIH